MERNFAWGDPSGIRDVFIQTYPEFRSAWINPEDVKYGRREGEISLITALSKIFSQYGTYKHWLITAGCTQAIHAAIYALRDPHTQKIGTRPLYFPFYPKMIEVQGLSHANINEAMSPSDIYLIDLPSNPLGICTQEVESGNIILDGAYLSGTYTETKIKLNPDAVFVGSIGKITGFSGLRLGFLATNSDSVYKKAYDWVCYGSIGATIVGQEKIAAAMTDDVRWAAFNTMSRELLELNRQQLNKISHIFDGHLHQDSGMFSFFNASERSTEILRAAGVVFVDGKSCGSKERAVRLNIGKSFDETSEMVNQVIKADRAR